MYKIIKDPNLACELRDMELLWWVSKENGGECYTINNHCIVTMGHDTIRENIARGCFGILLED